MKFIKAVMTKREILIKTLVIIEAPILLFMLNHQTGDFLVILALIFWRNFSVLIAADHPHFIFATSQL